MVFALLVPFFATLSSDKRRATFRRSDVQTIPMKFQLKSASLNRSKNARVA